VDRHAEPVDVLITRETRARVALLAHLSPGVRDVASLRLKGVPNNEVARRLGITSSAATRAWNRFTELCRAQLD